MDNKPQKKGGVFRSKFFIIMFAVPYAIWFAITLLAMVPDETNTDPLTWAEFAIANIVILLIWFAVSFVVSLIVYQIKKSCKKSQQAKISANAENGEAGNKSEIAPEFPPARRGPTEFWKSEEMPKPKATVHNCEELKHLTTARNLLIVLFILTLATLWFASMSINLFFPPHSQNDFAFTKNMWIFWLWLPIPILSVIFGFKYKKKGLKCTKNIVAGFIIGGLLLIFGSFCVIPFASADYGEIDAYRGVVDVQLPQNGELYVEEWESYGSNITDYTEVTAYYSEEDAKELEKSIKNNPHWISGNDIESKLQIFAPLDYYVYGEEYYSIYNKTADEHNALPSAAGVYEIYAMEYDPETSMLKIHKYKYEYKSNESQPEKDTPQEKSPEQKLPEQKPPEEKLPEQKSPDKSGDFL